jgi:alginate O-acetyltransferase complex protein AlgJ
MSLKRLSVKHGWHALSLRRACFPTTPFEDSGRATQKRPFLNNTIDRAVICLFLAGIVGFGAMSLAGPADVHSLARENRKPAEPPQLGLDYKALKKAPGQIEEFFNDRIAFRERLLRWHAAVRFELGASPTEKALIGRDGWLFLNEPKAESLTGRPPAIEDQFQMWLESFRKRADWLARRGIAYVVVPAPDKHSIYPEFLPDGARITPSPSAADLLRERFKGEPYLEFVDLRPALKNTKAERPVYFRTDTHWNEDGAYAAYRAIVERLARRWPKLAPLDRAAFVERTASFTGDLTRMMRLPHEQEEETISLQLRNPRARRLDLPVPLDPRLHSPKHIPPQAWGTGDRSLPRAVFFHDSFAERLLLPLLAEHFEVLVFAPSEVIDPKLIEQFEPDVVIQEMVERKFNWQRPLNVAGFYMD